MNLESIIVSSIRILLTIGSSLLLLISAIQSPIYAQSTTQPEELRPKLASFEEIVGENNPETELFQFNQNPNIYVLDFGGERGLRQQGQTMNRLAAFIEKKGAPKDRVLNDVELNKFILQQGNNEETFYKGHDYRASDLIRFYNAVEAQGIQLNKEELRLRDILIHNGFMEKTPQGNYAFTSPEKSIVSFPEEQHNNPLTPQNEEVTTEFRKLVLGHELSHGEYFTNEAYRKYCQDFWNSHLTEKERRKFRAFLQKRNYDTTNEELMVNETQAFLVHTSLSFILKEIRVPKSRLIELKELFLQNSPVMSYSK